MKQDPQDQTELYFAVLELLPKLHPSDITQIEQVCQAIKTLRRTFRGTSYISIDL